MSSEDQLAKVDLALDSLLLNEHVDPFFIDEDKLTLQQLISRIIYEKGSFIHLDEDELGEEISRLSESIQGDDMMEKENKEEAPGELEEMEDVAGSGALSTSNSSVNEQFIKNKNEVLKYVSAALNESSLSLDFVSLLISCVRPAAGTISMSQHLKKFVPPGSLNADSVVKPISEQEVQRIKELKFKEDKNLGQGWKLKSLENSSKNLRDACVRLSEEVVKEKVFWDIIKKNFNNKEILYKTRMKPSGKRVFAVKYGYEDSGSTYKVRGDAILKLLDNHDHQQSNQVEFTPINSDSKGNVSVVKKILRVRILKKQEEDDEFSIVGESKMDKNLFERSDESIKAQVEKARYFIFEEELFNQLMEEAAALMAYNVTVENESKFSIKSPNEEEIFEFEHVEYDDITLVEHISKPEDKRADVIATYLRLMLTVKFKKNLESKQQPNLVKYSNSVSLLTVKPYSLILRPLLGQIRHEFQVQRLYTSLKFVLRDVKEITFKMQKLSNLDKDEKDPFKRISTPPKSTFIIKISDKLKLSLVLDSFDYTNFIVSVKAFHGKKERKKVLDVVFEEIRQIDECLEWLIEQYKD